MSIKELQEYTRFSKYARYLPDQQRRETWNEQVSRVMTMHREKYAPVIDLIGDDIDFVESALLKKEVLGSQRALQFGGKPIQKINARMYNCTVSYIDRVRFFQEAMYVLLCGCGAGFSVQKHHIAKLPPISPVPLDAEEVTFVVPDSIEGWADSVGVLMSAYFTADQPFPEYYNKKVAFDFSQIRPAGSPISHGGKAPGPDGLQKSIKKIRSILNTATKGGDTRNLRPIEAYDIVMHISDSVLSGGIRRSATICLFSPEDTEMATAKTGNWFVHNAQRGRSNNSALLIRNETSKEQFSELMKSVKEFGEPGFVWADNKELIYNPCAEIGMQASDEKGRSGWQFCNLCEINMKKVKSEADFLQACTAAAVLGTLQAGYADFKYLGPITESIVKREALLGVSMTGMMDSPDIAFNPLIQRRGAKKVLEVNERVAEIIDINPAARATCVKPAGNSSCVLGTSSGIHAHHAKRYFRHVQANRLEPALVHFQKYNPEAIEDSVWSGSGTDVVIKFLCEVPSGSITKNQLSALDLLEHVKLTQQNWVETGTRLESCVEPWLRHNVSNTINVKPDEWDDVEKFIYKNKKWFAGISLLPMSGDKDYAQAPFTAVYTPAEISKEYGDGSLLASGLIVDGLRCFSNNLWAACDTVTGIGVIPLEVYDDADQYIDEAMEVFHYKSPGNGMISMSLSKFTEQKDWIRRAKQFSERYFESDTRNMIYCLKDVRNWKTWCDLRRTYKNVPWEDFTEDSDNTKVEQTVACSGGKCEF